MYRTATPAVAAKERDRNQLLAASHPSATTPKPRKHKKSCDRITLPQPFY
jgi:hypothetical protein